MSRAVTKRRWVAPLGLDAEVIEIPTEPAREAPRLHPGKGLSIRLEGAAKSFGHRQVLAGLDLDIPAGQFVAIVGRSGGGKTTLLRLLTGLDKPSAGRVLIDGVSVAGLQPSVRLLFQDARLLPWQRVISNVGIARAPGWREAAQAALADVGLADRANDWPAVLSGGQRQRVALARALAPEPQLIVLDEPVSALDVSIRAQIMNLLVDLQQQFHVSYLLIAHHLATTRYMAHEVAVMYLGKIVERAETEELYKNPLHPYTKALLSAAPIPDPAVGQSPCSRATVSSACGSIFLISLSRALSG